MHDEGFCRDCLSPARDGEARCPHCHGPRLLRHTELRALTIAHLDCDAFYAAIEKRDDPSLKDKPVIIGGARRGVVATACYVARVQGVKSAMPMFKALKLCPEAVVIRPNMAKYVAVGREVRALMLNLTPLVEPLSIDEAFMDLTGTERLHRHSAAMSLAILAKEIEAKVGITVSIGLSHNKYLAKVASDLEKPRGFSIIGKTETKAFLAERPVSIIWGAGRVLQENLARDGIHRIGQLQTMEKTDLTRRYGSIGARLYHLSRGEDVRHVSPNDPSRSVGAETTFDEDIADAHELERILWRMCERVSRRAKAEGVAGATVVLKLKTTDFKLRTRNTTLDAPSALANRIFDAARPLLLREAKGTAYRLLGVAISHLVEATAGILEPSLDAAANAKGRAELAIDRLRAKFGEEAVKRGLALRGEDG